MRIKKKNLELSRIIKNIRKNEKNKNKKDLFENWFFCFDFLSIKKHKIKKCYKKHKTKNVIQYHFLSEKIEKREKPKNNRQNNHLYNKYNNTNC